MGRYKVRGSYTVEGAVVMWVFLSIFLGTMYVGFYRYNQAVCKDTCCELAYKILRDGGETIQTKMMENWLKEAVIAMKHIQIQVEEKNEEVRVSIGGEMHVLMVPVKFFMDTRQVMKRENPTQHIRRMRWVR